MHVMPGFAPGCCLHDIVEFLLVAFGAAEGNVLLLAIQWREFW